MYARDGVVTMQFIIVTRRLISGRAYVCMFLDEAPLIATKNLFM